MHTEGPDELALGINNGKHIHLAAGFFHHGQGLAELGVSVHFLSFLSHSCSGWASVEFHTLESKDPDRVLLACRQGHGQAHETGIFFLSPL